jgi:protein-disulfide isomerase
VLDVLPRIEEQYVSSGRIRYEHHDFPIPVADPESYTAANAARAVATRTDGEAFWTYSRALFEKQSDLGPELYASLANEMDLDGDAVREAARALQQLHETKLTHDVMQHRLQQDEPRRIEQLE